MRRSVLTLTVMATVVLGAAGRAPLAAGQLVSEQLVSGQPMTALATEQLVTVTTTDVTGLLIDSACYLSKGARATADHTACAIACAQKGSRLALLTPAGGVYMVIGVLTQDNNAKLIPFINKAVVLTGTIGTRLDTSLNDSKTALDGRRLTTTLTEVVENVIYRRGDFREGDVPLGSEQTIDAISVRLPTAPGK
jgi:hypothetical protein